MNVRTLGRRGYTYIYNSLQSMMFKSHILLVKSRFLIFTTSSRTQYLWMVSSASMYLFWDIFTDWTQTMWILSLFFISLYVLRDKLYIGLYSAIPCKCYWSLRACIHNFFLVGKFLNIEYHKWWSKKEGRLEGLNATFTPILQVRKLRLRYDRWYI